MRELAPDEKIETVMIYTSSMLVRGDLILRENMRTSIWLRTQGVPNFIHLHNTQTVMLSGTPPKSYSKAEIFVPTTEVIGFHLAPPAQDPIDYDTSELNRRMQPVHVFMNSFMMTAKLRISTAAEISTSLDVLSTAWISLYDAEIVNPYLPQFNMRVPMLLAKPNKVMIGLA